MNIEEKLNTFLKEDESHAFLLFGPWGVGKTFAINKWLQSVKGYKVVELSLFGISNVNELNALALKEESIAKRFASWLKSVNQDANVGVGPVSVGLPLIGAVSAIVSLLAKPDEHSGKKKFLFVIDDIERKGNDLPIEKVLGFVDSLPKGNTKVVLVSNLEKLDGLKRFKGFKEKVIQDEFALRRPLDEAVKEIIGEKYSSNLIENAYPISNLRTLIRLKKILSIFDSKIDPSLIDCIYYCLLNICENRLGKNDLAFNYRKDLLRLERLRHLGLNEQKIDKKEIDEKVAFYIEAINNESDFLYENIKLLNLLKEIKEKELRAFVSKVYRLVSEERYNDLKSLSIPRRVVPLKQYREGGSNSVFYAKKPDDKYLAVMKDFEAFFQSNEYDKLDLFEKFCSTVVYCQDMVSKNSKGKTLERRIAKECPRIVSSYIFNDYNYDDDGADSLLFPFFKVPEWVRDLEKEMVRDYAKRFNEHFINEAKNKKINIEEMGRLLYLPERLFKDIIFEPLLFDVDGIMVHAIKHIDEIIDKDLDEESWHYCHSVIGWMAEKKGKFSFERSIELIKKKASRKNNSGFKFSILNEKLH